MYIELPSNLKLFKFPASAEIMLFLISEEMKNRRHINRLVQAGFDSTHACDLSMLILTLAGFNSRPDSLYEWYSILLNESSEKTSPLEIEDWKEAALEMYIRIKEKYMNDQST